MTYASAANTLARLAIGTADYLLQSNGTAPAWSSGTVSGYIMGASSSARRIQSGSGACTTAFTAVSFPVTYTATPNVIAVLVQSTVVQAGVMVNAVTTTGFTWATYYPDSSGIWLAEGR